MKLTKYEHACMVIEEGGSKLVIDPGVFTKSLTDVTDVAGVVVTDVHHDHFDVALLDKILAANPQAKIFTVPSAASQLTGRPVQSMKAGETAIAGPFRLVFYGGEHAMIHRSFPKAENVGVLVNQAFYYPGDSFVVPHDVEVNVLAVPVTGPWLKIGESMDFLAEVKPRLAFPTHDGLQNDASENMNNDMISGFAKAQGVLYHPLKVGEQLSIV